MHKRLLPILFLSIVILFMLPIPVEATTREEKAPITLYVGHTIHLKGGAREKKVSWTSSKKSILSVNQKGVVKAKKKGKATITATVKGKKSLKYVVLVKNPGLSRRSLTLKVGETYHMKLIGRSAKSWSVSDKSKVTISKNGIVLARKPGKVTITCRDRKKKRYTCRITVIRKTDGIGNHSADSTIRFLFVGNSKTYAGNIPGQFGELAKAAGKKVSVDSVTEGGRTLEYFASNEATAARISAKAYDYVVIQEQTDYAAWDRAFLNGAKLVYELVKKQNPKVKMIVRQTWYSQNSDQDVRDVIDDTAEWVAGNLPTELMSVEGKAMYYADEHGYPVFAAQGDVHQSAQGAYLIACCIYKVLWGSPVGISYQGAAGVHAYDLQKIADKNGKN